MSKLSQLREVSRSVNHNVVYVPDGKQYGVEEWWALPGKPGRGDCEDYVLEKMGRLRDLGWAKNQLDMGICRDRQGQGHAVLIAHTDEGDYILDNQTDAVLLWDQVPYKWIEMSVGGSFLHWVTIP